MTRDQQRRPPLGGDTRGILLREPLEVQEEKVVNPPLGDALAALRPWRSALLQAYLRVRIAGGGNQPVGDCAEIPEHPVL